MVKRTTSPHNLEMTMKSLRWGAIILAAALGSGTLLTACRSTFVVVPPPENGYTARDTLRGFLRGDEVRVVFRFDTIMRIDTVLRVDTLFREVRDPINRPDRLVRVDTVRVVVREPVLRVDTVFRVDSIRRSPTERVVRVDTVVVTATDTVLRTDTVRVVRTDTVRVVRTDTVRVVVTDTLRVPGRRLLFLPPGHYPPDGLCRVWIHGVPPGQQAAAAPCDRLGAIPAGAFILFGGDAWDFDYDWLDEAIRHPGTVPPEIVALKRRGGR
jgi:hypothetical protein